ncbi:MAG: FtsW/RodA/SpoVE family cell cycle protein [Eubacteriales bacterium]|nr:FtsW/RodA/SpoVE family cell cycle protein [Eubacteriales bacterium]
MFRKYKLKNFDFILVLLVAVLNIIGILAIGSAEESVQNKQIIGMALGLAAMLVVAFIDYSWILRFAWLGYLAALGTLVLVLFYGRVTNGARRWLELGFFDLQPSETAKILLILFYAQFIMKYKDRLNTLRVLFLAVFFIVPPLALIYKQPNLSTTILVAVLFCVLMFVGGISWKIIGGILAVAVPGVLVFLSIVMQEGQTLIENYQRNRIMAFFDPEAYADTQAYQQLNSVIAIGSGQLWGKGLNNTDIASVKNGNFLPESQTDFIFAVIGEELGFIGSAAVILLLILIAMRCVSIARTAKDTAGMVIAAGVGAMIGVQGFMNIAVATMLMPNTGLPLPFVSYGLSSLVSMYIGIGFVLNVRLQRKNLYNL